MTAGTAPHAPVSPQQQGFLWRAHYFLAYPQVELSETLFELFAVNNYAMAVGVLSHLAFIPLFLLLGASTLAAINVVSAGCFVLALVLGLRGKLLTSLAIGSIEVVAHAWVATLMLGWGTAFHLHAILALELIILFTWVSLPRRLLGAAVVAAAYVSLVAYATDLEPLVGLSAGSARGLAIMNAGIFLFVTTGVGAYHTWTVRLTRDARERAEEEMQGTNLHLLANEAELAQARDEAVEARLAAEQASQAKSMFLANMSHELRTPLNAIIGYSEMIAEDAADDGDEALGDDVQRIQAAGKHLLSLINSILDLSKIEAGRMGVSCTEFSLPELAREAVGTAMPLAEQNRNLLTVQIEDEVDFIFSDGTKVRQILFNLISNACKFTEGGEVELRVGLLEADPPTVEIQVRDTGIGMSNDVLDRVFKEFTQADGTTARKYGGTGLGLTITQRFCELLGGTIDVDSTEGEGTTFTVRLPAQSQDFTSTRPLLV